MARMGQKVGISSIGYCHWVKRKVGEQSKRKWKRTNHQRVRAPPIRRQRCLKLWGEKKMWSQHNTVMRWDRPVWCFVCLRASHLLCDRLLPDGYCPLLVLQPTIDESSQKCGESETIESVRQVGNKPPTFWMWDILLENIRPEWFDKIGRQGGMALNGGIKHKSPHTNTTIVKHRKKINSIQMYSAQLQRLVCHVSEWAPHSSFHYRSKIPYSI